MRRPLPHRYLANVRWSAAMARKRRTGKEPPLLVVHRLYPDALCRRVGPGVWNVLPHLHGYEVTLATGECIGRGRTARQAWDAAAAAALQHALTK